MADDPYALAATAAAKLSERTGGGGHVAAVVLGSGWLPAADALGKTLASVSTSELPGFAAPTVAGHHGELRSVEVGDRRVLVLLGRNHLYEGRSEAEVVHPVRVAVLAGVPVVILTNAAGGIDPQMRPGQPVLLRDQLNLTGRNPLTGPPPPEELGPRFIDLTTLYPERLRRLAREVDPSLAEGVYAGVLGPSYETPAEVAMFARARRGSRWHVDNARSDRGPALGSRSPRHLARLEPRGGGVPHPARPRRGARRRSRRLPGTHPSRGGRSREALTHATRR